MNICIDVGNTTFVVGLYDGSTLIKKDFFLVENKRYKDDFSSLLRRMNIELRDIDKVMYSSVVPNVDEVILPILGDKVRRVKSSHIDIKFGQINMNEVGDDLIAALVGADKKYHHPTLIADLGTASKVLLLDKDGVFDTCLIIPGLSMSIASLSNKAALLPDIELQVPSSALAHNTVEAMNAGVILGHADMLTGLFKRIEKEIGYPCKHVLTGGSAIYLKDIIKDEFIYDENLTLDGLRELLGD